MLYFFIYFYTSHFLFHCFTFPPRHINACFLPWFFKKQIKLICHLVKVSPFKMRRSCILVLRWRNLTQSQGTTCTFSRNKTGSTWCCFDIWLTAIFFPFGCYWYLKHFTDLLFVITSCPSASFNAEICVCNSHWNQWQLWEPIQEQTWLRVHSGL